MSFRKLRRASWWVLPALAVCVSLIALTRSDERAVKRRLRQLVEACEKQPGQSLLRSLSDSADLRSFFTSNAVLRLGRPYPVEATPGEFASLVARAHLEFSGLEIDILGIEILPRAERNRMDMLTSVRIRAMRDREMEEYSDDYRVRWRNVEGVWKIEFAGSESPISMPLGETGDVLHEKSGRSR